MRSEPKSSHKRRLKLTNLLVLSKVERTIRVANTSLGRNRPAARNLLTEFVFTHHINRSRTIAVRNDMSIWHSNAKCILTLLHIPRIYPRKGNSNPNFTCEQLRIIHLTDGEDITRSALLFVPSCSHGSLQGWSLYFEGRVFDSADEVSSLFHPVV
jgi:hypothetical protein